jgi:hypothetical protein
MKPRAVLSALLALSLGACATVQRYDAAGDIHALLISIRDNDRQAFDAHVDRPALNAQMKGVLTAEMIKRAGALGGLVAQGLSGIADPLLDSAIQPSVFLAVAESKGYRPSQPLPGRAAIAAALRPLENDRVASSINPADGACWCSATKRAYGAWSPSKAPSKCWPCASGISRAAARSARSSTASGRRRA